LALVQDEAGKQGGFGIIKNLTNFAVQSVRKKELKNTNY
jgi:enhancing lycopene biosynthesis protein 2